MKKSRLLSYTIIVFLTYQVINAATAIHIACIIRAGSAGIIPTRGFRLLFKAWQIQVLLLYHSNPVLPRSVTFLIIILLLPGNIPKHHGIIFNYIDDHEIGKVFKLNDSNFCQGCILYKVKLFGRQRIKMNNYSFVLFGPVRKWRQKDATQYIL